MGGAVSLQQRCRKALVIKAYNARPPEQTLEEQFSAFSYLKNDGQFYTNADLIKQCLKIGAEEYPWIDPLMQVLSGQTHGGDGSSVNRSKGFEIKLCDFISFLETGVFQISDPPTNPPFGARPKGGPETPPRKPGSSSDLTGQASPGATGGKGKQFPPVPPQSLDSGGIQSHNHSRSSVDVISFDLSRVVSEGDLSALPKGIKLQHDGTTGKSGNQHGDSGEDAGRDDKHSDGPTGEDGEEEETLTIIVSPRKGKPGDHKGPVPHNGKQLWRKREIVRQERTIHYTTIDESGETQELIEKETTQTEVLHMECRETGEFAHKETTAYENVETFNEEVVNEVRGHEEYVHLKSLEDEFHYMDSTMPPKDKGGGGGGGGDDKEGPRSPSPGGGRQRRGRDGMEEEEDGNDRRDAKERGYSDEFYPPGHPPQHGQHGGSAEGKDPRENGDGEYVFTSAEEEEEYRFYQQSFAKNNGGHHEEDDDHKHHSQAPADTADGESAHYATAEDPIVTHVHDPEDNEIEEVYTMNGFTAADLEPPRPTTLEEEEAPAGNQTAAGISHSSSYQSMHDID